MREMNKILHIFISNDYLFSTFECLMFFPNSIMLFKDLEIWILKEISVQNFNVKMKY